MVKILRELMLSECSTGVAANRKLYYYTRVIKEEPKSSPFIRKSATIERTSECLLNHSVNGNGEGLGFADVVASTLIRSLEE